MHSSSEFQWHPTRRKWRLGRWILLAVAFAIAVEFYRDQASPGRSISAPTAEHLAQRALPQTPDQPPASMVILNKSSGEEKGSPAEEKPQLDGAARATPLSNYRALRRELLRQH
jgi:hypothetical protein